MTKREGIFKIITRGYGKIMCFQDGTNIIGIIARAKPLPTLTSPYEGDKGGGYKILEKCNFSAHSL